MVRKALALLVVVALVGVALGVVGLWIPGLAGAHGHSAARSFPDGNSVPAGGELTVQITARDFGSVGARVVETLPEGFVYQSSSLPIEQEIVDTNDSRNVTFAIVLESSPFTFTYTVKASETADTYRFSGTIKDIPRDQDGETRTIGGDTEVMVTASDMAMPMASRAFSPATVMMGDPVTVTITASGYGASGMVAETLPTGFMYTGSSSLDGANVSTSGQMVTFTLPAEGEMATEFTYTVTASDMAGMHDFSGELTDAEGMMHTVGGAMMVMVEAAPVMMEGPRASRIIAPASVTEGGDVRVTVTVMDYGQIGAVVEMLPMGFMYVDGSSTLSDSDVAVDGRNVTFALLEPNQATFSYTARATAAGPGTHGFSGNLIDDQQMMHMVGGESDVMVQARIVPGAPRAERSFSMEMTGLGDEITVTITAMNYGQIGAVVETMPMGFTYVMDSSSLPDVEMDGRELTFALLDANNTTFSYKVLTPTTAGDYDFLGNLVDDQQMMHMVGGDSRIKAGPTAMRSFPASTVRTGANLDVMITARDYGSLGAVVETLPNGFAYVSSDLAYFEEDGNELRFALLDANNSSFMYTVRAPSSPGNYDFMGELVDDDQMRHDVRGDMTVMVEAPPIVEPEPDRPSRPSRGRGGGGGGGGGYAPPVATATPMPTRAPSTPVPTIAPTPTQIIVPTIPAAATPVPEPTMPPPTEMPTARPKPTKEVVMIPTVAPMPVPTAVPPTEAPEPTAVPPTAVPPTEVPPTAMVEPTEPAAPTATIAPTVAPVTPVTPDEDGMPTWLIILIIVIIVAVVIAAVGFYMIRMRR